MTNTDIFKNAYIEKMANGELCIELTEKINFEDFEDFAEIFLEIIPAEIIDKIEAVTIIMWTIKINNKLFYLVFDDYPVMMSLEPIDKSLDKEILQIFKKIKDLE
ncbi:hypothetical protein [uncultured Gammaproteobacteria bacterium]|nr:hypothetical protein [uncultured Gammaproteobacteria bacterium]CAC9993939.1 hypothetical protein [uncultured Gammaproteobacteria bacterium]